MEGVKDLDHSALLVGSDLDNMWDHVQGEMICI